MNRVECITVSKISKRPMTPPLYDLSLDQPTLYEIRVGGVVDDSWSGRLGGMHISTERADAREPVTVLAGEIEDQAALNGILTTLYGLGLRLLSVKTT
jgi:hypothetical protein